MLRTRLRSAAAIVKATDFVETLIRGLEWGVLEGQVDENDAAKAELWLIGLLRAVAPRPEPTTTTPGRGYARAPGERWAIHEVYADGQVWCIEAGSCEGCLDEGDAAALEWGPRIPDPPEDEE